MHLPVRPIAGALPAALERRLRRFVWTDPRVVEDPSCSAAQFRTAMAAFHVGKTIKITGVGRHRLADELLAREVETAGATVVDIGASDGSTSLELLERIPDVARLIIADLYFTLESARRFSRTFYFGPDGRLVLVATPRWLAWPTESRLLQRLFARSAERARECGDRREVLLLNPDVRSRMQRDGRITTVVHDIFEPWTGDRPDVIKVANLLRRLYFTDAEIRAALGALFVSLPPGGTLLVVDNPRIAGIDERAGLYRRGATSFEPLARTPHAPEIDDLVLGTRSADVAARFAEHPLDQ